MLGRRTSIKYIIYNLKTLKWDPDLLTPVYVHQVHMEMLQLLEPGLEDGPGRHSPGFSMLPGGTKPLQPTVVT